ncbi:MAG: trigger factor [Oscillibacter sp.]|jgi:trigger factor|nr:trigger factor [Oscillibacter sp.]
MSVKSCEKLEKNEVALTIEVGAEQFEAAVEKAYYEKRKDIRVPGFRPGKAPRQLIEKMYGEGVFYSDAIDNVWFDAYKSAIEEEKLQIVGDPKVELVGEVTKDGFTFKATVPVYPEVTLGQYKGLSAAKAEVKVSAADVDEKLKELTDRNTRLVSADREAKNGDVAVIDYKGTENGRAFEGGTAENYSLELGSGSFVPGFEEQVVGMKAGEEKDIDITFPEDYHKDLAGKAVVFHVKVNEVKEKEIPALDDEFAKDVSEFDTLKDLKADLKKKITAEREDAAKQGFEDLLMQQIADNITCDVPDAMVETQAKRFLDNFRTQIQSQGIPYEQYLKLTKMDENKLLEDAKEPALKQVRVDLALAAIIKEEKIEVTDDEIEAEYKDLAEKYGMDVETVKKYLQKDAIEDQVKSRKAIAVVSESATATKPEAKKAEDGEEKPAKKPAAKKTTAKKAEDGEKKPAAKKTAAKKTETAEKKPAAKKTAKKTEESK